MKKILLTGSSGYIGKNFIHLYKDKYDIIEVDRKSGVPIKNISKDWFKLYDHIVHLAAISGIQKCEEDLNQTIEDNVLSTNIIVEASRDNNIPITFASSQAAKDGSNTYAFTKKIGEQNILTNTLNSYILRFSNVYGGVDYLTDKTSVVAVFLNALKNDQPLHVNGNGSQIRDFVHVNDICNAINKTIETPLQNNMIIDIGTGVETSILELAKMISPESILYKSKSNNIGVAGNTADIDYMNDILDMEIQESLTDYIKSMKG